MDVDYYLIWLFSYNNQALLSNVQKVREEALKPERSSTAGVAGTPGYFQIHGSIQLASYTSLSEEQKSLYRAAKR